MHGLPTTGLVVELGRGLRSPAPAGSMVASRSLMTPSKILCAVDFSPGSHQAMRAAIRIANEADAELVLVHIWNIPELPFTRQYVFSPEVMQELQEGSQGALATAVSEATALGARRLTSRLLNGMPRQEIVKLVEHDPAFDLVVVGTHGRTGLARVLLGSIAEGIVRHAPCSVLVVRPDSEAKPFTRVLCPIDFSDSSWYAVELAARFLPSRSGEIALLYVIDPPDAYIGKRRESEFALELDRYCTEHLDRWADQLAAKTPASVIKLSQVGRPGAEILEILDQRPAFDLVVMGSHGRTGLERVLLGSVAEKVVRHAKCPVLVARRRAGSVT